MYSNKGQMIKGMYRLTYQAELFRYQYRLYPQSALQQILHPKAIIEWALDSRSYKNGMIVILDEENIPLEKVLFEDVACVNFDLDYTKKGKSYIFTKIGIRAERMTVGSGYGINFDNNWVR